MQSLLRLKEQLKLVNNDGNDKKEMFEISLSIKKNLLPQAFTQVQSIFMEFSNDFPFENLWICVPTS